MPITQLAGVRAPVTVVIGEKDKFIRTEYAEYLARSIPGAELIVFPDVSHFPPLQRPETFNREMLRFLDRFK
ncbi:hypothetical protein PPNSA23_47080 [Phyllobacterium phragmitis]|uniref:AB hydrolase-1 domain-containing protein n=1 Tax=Phyllobacterium phragmitis TaxID=2670329 RepID=A0ABQ0H767_9HYPH